MKPDTYCGLPRVTRRHLIREVRTVLRYPLTMLEEKRVSRGVHVLSHFRVILMLFAVGYYRHWPGADAGWPIITLGIVIALALALRDLAQRVPVAEGLAALTAIAQRVAVVQTAQIVEVAEVAVEKIEAAGVEAEAAETTAETQKGPEGQEGP